MLNPIRRLVSGAKARTQSDGVDLDLVYVTDQVCIMGYPASGVAGLYRNKRSDVLEWLETNHGRKFHLFNFCPRTENEYPKEYFYGQVSRYPFPDHHPPPLSMIPLFVDEIAHYLKEDPENLAVIHCKAGKGRSGTMTCCYLLSLPTLPKPPSKRAGKDKAVDNPKASLSATSSEASPLTSASISPTGSQHGGVARDAANLRGDTKGDESRQKVEQMLAHLTVEDDHTVESPVEMEQSSDIPSNDDADKQEADLDPATAEVQDIAEKMASVFDLHSRQRMKPDSGKRGVSIPSQQRFVHYWTKVLLGQDPRQRSIKRTIRIDSVEIHMPERMPKVPGLLSRKPISVAISIYKPSYRRNLAQREDELYARRQRKAEGHADTAPTAWNDDVWDDKEDLIQNVGNLAETSRRTSEEASDSENDEKEASPVLHWRTLKPLPKANPIVVDGDAEVQMKLLVGKTGRKHGLLPDVGSVGYCWFIPSFEPKDDAEGRVAFSKGDIDFFKSQSGIAEVVVKWSWLEAASA